MSHVTTPAPKAHARITFDTASEYGATLKGSLATPLQPCATHPPEWAPTGTQHEKA